MDICHQKCIIPNHVRIVSLMRQTLKIFLRVIHGKPKTASNGGVGTREALNA